MRLVTWNCRIGGFRYKSEHMALLRPDVLAVQEVEPIDGLLIFAGECQPTYSDRLAHPLYRRRSIGVFSYTSTSLEALDHGDPMYEFRRFRGERDGLRFQVAAVWTAATTPPENSYRQAIDGVRRYENWMQNTPTVMLGDFNDNASYQSTRMPELLGLLDPMGLVSAYHSFFGEPFGGESQPTYYHRSRTGGFVGHLDYCFVPRSWAAKIVNVQVGTHDSWLDKSDHMPVIVDLDL